VVVDHRNVKCKGLSQHSGEIHQKQKENPELFSFENFPKIPFHLSDGSSQND